MGGSQSQEQLSLKTVSPSALAKELQIRSISNMIHSELEQETG